VSRGLAAALAHRAKEQRLQTSPSPERALGSEE
jgi:hypothetical protein